MENLFPRAGELEAIEIASRDEISALQLERMTWSLTHAYENSPFYNKRFDEAGVHPSDLKTLSDLAKFPFTTKKDLRDTYPFGMFAVPREKLARLHASSGTTGKPTVVGYTAKDVDIWANVVARSIRRWRPRRRSGACRIRLRPVHRWSWCTLRRGKARLHGSPCLRRDDGTAGDADRGFQAAHHHGYPLLHAVHPR